MKTSELLAAKSSFEDNTKWLPFNVHANDTAGIIKRLFNKWIAQNVRRRLCAAIGIESSENAEEIVCNYCKFIALVHDISSGGNLSHLLFPVFSSILLFCIFQQLFFCTHNRISQNYPPYRMSGKEGKYHYNNGVNVFFEYITLYLRGVPELTLRRSACSL